MHVVFDHISGLLIFGAVMLIFAFIQFRGWQTASEATINYKVYSDAVAIGQFLATDLENMRTEDQTNSAIGKGKLTGGAAFTCQINASGDLTTSFTFPTLADPENAYTLTDPDDAEIILVTYQLTDSGQTFKLQQGNTSSTVPLYSLDRMIGANYAGGTQNTVTHFFVEYYEDGAIAFTSTPGSCPTNLSKVRFELKLVTNGLSTSLDGQENTNQINVSRFGTTVSLTNWN